MTEPPSDLILLQRENAHLETMVQHLTAAIVNADMANLAKSKFLANMSHELRTPLHAIKSFTHFILKRSTALMQDLDKVTDPVLQNNLSEQLHLDRLEWEEGVHFWLTRIMENQERQLDLVNNLLDLVKLEAGKMPLNFTVDDLLKTVRGSVEELEPLLQEKAIVLTIVGQEGAQACLDHAQLRGVVKNLLGNALKFTPVGGAITFTLEEGLMGDLPALVLRVRDTGCGIPEGDLEIIFDPFVQSRCANGGGGGSGLGLAICRAIVLAHGGTITVRNHPDGGAEFTVVLPKNAYKKEPTPCGY